MTNVVRIQCGGTKVTGSIVLGVHWTPALRAREYDSSSPADLDAVCELRDCRGRLVELVGPGRLRSLNGSVMHTGDSRTGASLWDDERIFVFLDALPEDVASVVLSVESSGGHVFRDIAGASCHVSDCVTEDKLLSVLLTGLGPVTGHVIAMLERGSRGWILTSPLKDSA